ncbi:glycosyltransferase family 2 protein, partial [Jidongwangia harbinensis]|uniref:glycosyltransferase family 2 protein n=1 Tax=Jidongwangia harbinensis TaxID=2878561 RepID=UPI001CDA0AEE
MINGDVWTPEPRAETMLSAPAIEPTGAVRPAAVYDIDVADPLPTVPAVGADGRRVRRAWMLVRLFTEPLGTVLVDVPAKGLRPADVAAAINVGLGTALAPKLAGYGLTALPVDGITPDREPAFLARRREVLATAPHITVVVCTRERPDALARCLDSLLTQDYPGYRILVVDNAPVTDT